MQSIVRYAQRTLDAQAERFAQVIAGMPPEALTWRPADETTNSVAQIIRHVYSWQPWYLGVALGDPVPLDDAALNQKQEDSLHNGAATTEELAALLGAARTETTAALTRLADIDLEAEISPYGDAEPRSFYVTGAIDHAAEHIGHAELTKQLWEQRR